jgi:intraflagellar transport protein 46
VGRPLGKDVSAMVEIDFSLTKHRDMICNMLNIPLNKRQTQSLHSELKNSQHFKPLAEGKKAVVPLSNSA